LLLIFREGAAAKSQPHCRIHEVAAVGVLIGALLVSVAHVESAKRAGDEAAHAADNARCATDSNRQTARYRHLVHFRFIFSNIFFFYCMTEYFS
tara:strand:- start:786 stop:1067 length:282 start_codon:yes stop_codon:yes gene_type:complete